jgi:hypothetical protein
MFKVGDIVEPKNTDSKYIMGYPHDYYEVIKVELSNITVVCVNDGFAGLEYYVDSDDWEYDKGYLRGLKIKQLRKKING